MNAATLPAVEYFEAKIRRDLDKGLLQTLEGTLQRVNYQKRELSVVAEGKVWHFTLDPDCQLWFDDRQAILRCFHPLDRVKVVFAYDESGNAMKAMYAWERK